jgi:threonine/homoserine/homoserine lactone efflux protein
MNKKELLKYAKWAGYAVLAWVAYQYLFGGSVGMRLTSASSPLNVTSGKNVV